MKIKVDDDVVFELNDIKKSVILNDIPEELFNQDIKRRIKYVVEHKYEQCMKRLKEKWEPILAERMSEIPTDKDSLASLIFSQKDYKNRSKREQEENEV